MSEEYDALMRNKTWTLVPSNTAQNIVGCKWVFRLKHNADGSIQCFLLPNDFINVPGLIFMLPSAQAYSNTSLFIYNSSTALIYVLIYVDDIIITGPSTSQILDVISKLGSRFSLKDLGPLHFFLNIEVVPLDNGLLLTQSKFIAELLSRFNMLDTKGVSTPMSSTEPLLLNDGSPPTNSKEYRQVIGALQYLKNPRPDISFAVNRLAQFMHLPSIKHWQAAKHLLRYLKQTITLGLHINHSDTTRLTAYSDADWGSDPDSRVSTSAYIIFHGRTPISWSSKI
ncbi:PREDICTED: uncharacterized protein LOC109239027 [Nicotiana attenuata]|uniref:uncharacterized protein LOC109239027 n=1 Tax=Nicotiana attenuata TaxID=49451 RepID=UPI0009056BB7|nr:PREDICTED: uncharacterized protein LOC109239027 [Nicotiana attenuata]